MNNIREAVQKKLTSLVDNDMSVKGGEAKPLSA